MTCRIAFSRTSAHLAPFLIGALSISGVALAQGFEQPRAVFWPQGVSGAFGKTLVGDLTGDGVAEAVVMRGSSPIVMYGTNDYGTAGEIPTDADDIAIHDEIGPGYTDAVLTAGPAGVFRWTLTGQWDFVGAEIAGDWTAPRRIALDGNVDSQFRYAAVLDGQATIHTLICYPGVDAAIATFALPGTVGEIEVADLDGDGICELVATYDGGLWISSLAGTGSWTVARAQGAAADLATERVVVFRNANESFDRLAWLADGSHDIQSLTLINAAGVQGVVDLDGWDVIDLAAGFAGSDPLADLCLTLAGDQSAVVMLNGPGGPIGMDFSTTAVLGLGSATTGSSTARAAFHDVDNDGDDDVLLPTESLSVSEPPGATGVGVALFESRDESADDLRPWINACMVGISPFGEAGDFGYFCIFDLLLPSAPSGATGYDLKVWQQQVAGGGIEDEPVLEAEYPLGGPTSFNLYFDVYDGLPGDTPFDVRHIEFRYVRRVPGEPIVAYPPLQAPTSAFHLADVGEPSCPPGDGPPCQPTRPKEGGMIVELPPPPFPPGPLPDD